MTKTGALGVLSATGLNPTTGFPYAPKVKDFIAKRKQQLKSKAKLNLYNSILTVSVQTYMFPVSGDLCKKVQKCPLFQEITIDMVGLWISTMYTETPGSQQ